MPPPGSSDDEDNVEFFHDEIDESLENLLIFPTIKGLKRCSDLIEEYFRIEMKILAARGKKDNEAIEEGQERIRAITSATLGGGGGGRKDPFASCDSG